MRNIYKIYPVVLICVIAFTTCKKYPEDGKRSWHNPEKRLTTGTWILKEYLVDGIDSSNKWYSYYDPSLFDTIKWNLLDMKYYFNSGNNKSSNYQSNFVVQNFYFLNAQGNSISTFHSYGNWRLVNKNKSIEFNTTYINENITLYILGVRVDKNWEIRKLTDKEFIVESENVLAKKVRLKFNKL